MVTIEVDETVIQDVPYNYAAGEQAMWRAVIVQALMDAASLSHKPENQNYKREALNWLRGRSEDFYVVCHYAGLDPDCTREMIKGALERGCTWRIVPGMGERAAKETKAPTARR